MRGKARTKNSDQKHSQIAQAREYPYDRDWAQKTSILEEGQADPTGKGMLRRMYWPEWRRSESTIQKRPKLTELAQPNYFKRRVSNCSEVSPRPVLGSCTSRT